MCGIAGVLSTEPEAKNLAPALAGMHRAIAHRGPDDQGAWTSSDCRATFAHTRLSIIDLSPAGHQPMSTPDGRYTITFNGEIYNFLELRRELEERGARFATRSDTEVILQAYAVKGPACFADLRGMFALAIWDATERTAIVARDRFGIKPFYYHAGARRLVFASEVKALIASGLVSRHVDADAMYGYFRSGTVPEPGTLLRDVRCLEAGHVGTWRDGSFSSRPYWTLRFGATPAGGDAAAVTRAALLDSVSHHFVSDTPVGLFLSGGIDSTAIAALAAASGQRDLHTFSIAFPGMPDDEGALARRTAAHFGTTHAEWAIDAATGKALFERFLTVADQPSIDGLNVYAVAKFARERGLKVVLSGLGGDELFGGYKSFDAVPALAAWRRRLDYAGPLAPMVGRALERFAPQPRARRLGDWLNQPPGLAAAYETFRGIFTRAEAKTLVERYAGETPSASPAPPAPVDPTDRDAVSRLEMTRYMKNQPLRDADTMSMAWGLELRVPFLDGPLVDTLTDLPASERLRPGKRLLLEAVPEIPEWITSQPKRGFLFPIDRWLDGEWRDTFDEVSRRSPVAAGTWYRAWCVFMLDRWLDRLQRSTHA